MSYGKRKPYSVRKLKQILQLPENATLRGKTVAVTGTTGGIGYYAVHYLCMLGADIIAIDRNARRQAALIQQMQENYPSCRITPMTADLEDIGSVRAVCDALQSLTVDYFVHNAGAYSIPRHVCTTGYDNVFQINFVSPYYIMRRLLEHNPKIKLIAMGSIAHTYKKTNPEDVDFKTVSAASHAYGNAKRFLMFSLYGMAKKDPTCLSVVHPGITFTNITSHYPPWLFCIIKHPMKVIFTHPRKASLCIIGGIFDHTAPGTWIGPRFFSVWGSPRKQLLCTVDAKEQEAIGRQAEEIYKKLP